MKSNPLSENKTKEKKSLNKSLQTSLEELPGENYKINQSSAQVVLHCLKNTLFGEKKPQHTKSQ